MFTTSFLLLLATLTNLGSVQGQEKNHRNRVRSRHVMERRTNEAPREGRELKGVRGHDGFETEEEPGTSRLFVTYRNAKGKEEAIDVAEAIHQDFDRDSVIVVEVDRDGANLLLKDENIVSVEEDSIWEEQGYLERYLDADEVRRLQVGNEIVPYGIRQAQGNQLQYGPYPAPVCLVDTGVAVGHPDLVNSYIHGMDRMSKEQKRLQWSRDFRGHGTHVAGTAGATCGNGIGVCGMGNGTVDVVITRGLNNEGRAYESDIIEAIEQCVDSGAKVISLSLGGTRMSSQMHTLFDDLHDKGIVTFAASGNTGSYVAFYPAAHSKVISVSANNANTEPWVNSNFGPWVELSAAGDRVLSTTVSNNQFLYAEYSGTSMATPHCAAAAGLLMSHFPHCTNNQIRYALAYTAWDTKGDGCDDAQGYGIIQVRGAYEFLLSHSCQGSNWGQKVSPDSMCSTIDQEPDSKGRTRDANFLKRR